MDTRGGKEEKCYENRKWELLINSEYTEKQLKSSAHSLLTLSKPIVSCGDGGEYRCSEGSMLWATIDRERTEAKG